MSDLGFDHVEAPRHHREQAFETDCFDSDVVRKRYGIDLEQHCWAEIRNTGNLYKHLTAFLGKYATHSFEPCVGVKELSCAEEMFGDDEPPKTVNLNCGLGLTTMKHTTAWGQLVSIKALHQRRGPIVGGRCGAETWENLVIFVEGSENKNALQDFLKAVVNHEAEPSLNEYTIYRWHVEHSYWRHAATKTSRSIDSVVLPRVSKDKIIADLDAFLTKETFRFYTSHGIPYKRSYLFYGVPGAGKTSLLTAIAGKYRRNLCIMQPTDPRFTDDTLADAIKEAPRRSIIVLEDVDALFHKNREAKNAKMTISFSGLLNALDGIGNPDGQIFVLTTNFRENLDGWALCKFISRHIAMPVDIFATGMITDACDCMQMRSSATVAWICTLSSAMPLPSKWSSYSAPSIQTPPKRSPQLLLSVDSQNRRSRSPSESEWRRR